MDKKIAGVCGGIAETYDLDPSLVRVGAIFLCLITAIVPVVITYMAAWMIFPKGDSTAGAGNRP
jgi:phage shock protein PspC (stress-responsive transcriptional regulator)